MKVITKHYPQSDTEMRVNPLRFIRISILFSMTPLKSEVSTVIGILIASVQLSSYTEAISILIAVVAQMKSK